jgi:hypothetical protein
MVRAALKAKPDVALAVHRPHPPSAFPTPLPLPLPLPSACRLRSAENAVELLID